MPQAQYLRKGIQFTEDIKYKHRAGIDDGLCRAHRMISEAHRTSSPIPCEDINTLKKNKHIAAIEIAKTVEQTYKGYHGKQYNC